MEEEFFRGRPFVAVNQNGYEYIFEDFPHRVDEDDGDGYWEMDMIGSYMRIPKGSIKKLIGRELSWNDEPVELKEE